MAACLAFMMMEIEDAWEHWGDGWENVEDYGSTAYGHKLHTWDEGVRKLHRCNRCGGYILFQRSEYHAELEDADSFYTDFFPVESPEEADEINFRYDGFQIEKNYPKRFLCVTDGRYHWAKGSEED